MIIENYDTSRVYIDGVLYPKMFIAKVHYGEKVELRSVFTEKLFGRIDFWYNISVDGVTGNSLKETLDSINSIVFAPDNPFSGYFQWIIKGISTEIIALGGGGYGYKNFGIGGSDVDTQILNTQVGYFDGSGAYVKTANKFTWDGTSDFEINTTITSSDNPNTFDQILNVQNQILLFARRSNSSNKCVFAIMYSDNSILFIEGEVLTNGVDYEITAKIESGTAYLIINENEYSAQLTKQGKVVDDFVYIGIQQNLSSLTYFKGSIHNIGIVNNFKYYFQEGQGVTIYDQSGNGNNGTVTGATLSEFWGTKSDAAYPALQAYGGSKDLVCTVAGTTAHLALPDGSNLGNNLFTGFTILGTGWTDNGDGTYTCDGTSSDMRANILTLSEYYRIKINVIDIQSGYCNFPVGASGATGPNIYDTGEYIRFGKCAANTIFYAVSSGFVGTIKIEYVQEVTAVDLTAQDNVWEFTCNKVSEGNILRFEPIINAVDVYPNIKGYNLFIFNDESIRFSMYDNTNANTIFQTSPNYIELNTNYTIKITRSQIGLFTFYIKGGTFGNEYVLMTAASGSNPILDNTHDTTKFLVAYNSVKDEITNIKLNGERYDFDNFIDDTGTYGVRKVVGAGDELDAKGNELQYSGGFWNTGNIIDWVQGDAGLIALAEAYGIPYPEITYDEIKAIDTSVIPEEDFQVDNSGDVIKNWAAQPYTKLLDVNGEVVKTVEGNPIYAIKDF